METEKGRRIEQILATDVTREQLAEALWCAESSQRMWHGCAEENRSFRLKAEAENAKLREQVERLQPKDCEGNVLDIADTVSMLRSEYDGDHEWDDVVVELVLTKWGVDRWIVRGSKGEAWACDCTKTGYDEDAYEASDDVEPFGEPTLLEVENAKLRELVRLEHECNHYANLCEFCPHNDIDFEHEDIHCGIEGDIGRLRCELGIEVDE